MTSDVSPGNINVREYAFTQDTIHTKKRASNKLSSFESPPLYNKSDNEAMCYIHHPLQESHYTWTSPGYPYRFGAKSEPGDNLL